MDESIFTSAFHSSIYEIMFELLTKVNDSSSLLSLFGLSSLDDSSSLTESSVNSPYSSSSSFSELIQQAAEKYDVNPELIEAVIQAESNFDSDAVSTAGAEGLMQLMPTTAESLGVIDSMDPEQNIDGGTKLLASLMEYYDGNVKLALAAYNAGAGTVDYYDGIPPYEETQTYVKRVLDLYKSNL